MSPRSFVAASGLALVVAAAAACSSGGSQDADTLPEVTLFTTTTTSTVPVFEEADDTDAASGSEPSASTTSTATATSTADTTTSDTATTSTAAITTTTTSTATSTTSPDLGADAPFELAVDGLGAAAFGADPDGIIGYVSSFIGGPTADTGYVDPFEFGVCSGTQARRVSWGSLMLEFGDASDVAADRLHFYAYQYGTEDPAGLAPGTPAGLETPEGLTYGSTVAQLIDVYPDVTFLQGDEFVSPSFIVNDNLRGLLTGLSDLDTVTVVTGGLPCEG